MCIYFSKLFKHFAPFAWKFIFGAVAFGGPYTGMCFDMYMDAALTVKYENDLKAITTLERTPPGSSQVGAPPRPSNL